MKGLPPEVQIERPAKDLKAIRRARYLRQYARNKPPAPGNSYPAELRLTPRQRALVTIRGVPEFLQQVARMKYGPKGTWGHGLQPNGTRKGPGIRPLPRWSRSGEDQPLLPRDHPAGTKLVRRFIRDARGEQVEYRKAYAELTGKHYG